MCKVQTTLTNMTTTTTDYAEFKVRKEEARQVNSARVRCWGVALGHFILPPVASVAYAVKTGKWAPTLVATGAAIVATPLAVVDLGITLMVVPSSHLCGDDHQPGERRPSSSTVYRT